MEWNRGRVEYIFFFLLEAKRKNGIPGYRNQLSGVHALEMWLRCEKWMSRFSFSGDVNVLVQYECAKGFYEILMPMVADVDRLQESG